MISAGSVFRAASRPPELKTPNGEYEDLTSGRARLTAEERERSIKEYLTLVMKRFAQSLEHQQKKILQTIVPIVVIHPDNRLELRLKQKGQAEWSAYRL